MTVVDSTYFHCDFWNGRDCLHWTQVPGPEGVDSTDIDTFLVTDYDPALSRFDPGHILVVLRSGDANGNHGVNVADAVYLINYVFKAGEAPPMPYAGDCNCDRAINVADVVKVINYVFKGDPEPDCLQ
jgi:hypothetical protein